MFFIDTCIEGATIKEFLLLFEFGGDFYLASADEYEMGHVLLHLFLEFA